jgi:hypothetical protein
MRRPRKTSPRVAEDKERTMSQPGQVRAKSRPETSSPVNSLSRSHAGAVADYEHLPSTEPHAQLQGADERERLEAELREGYRRMSAESEKLRAEFDPLTYHLLNR